MTTDTKQPPDTDRLVLMLTPGGRIVVGQYYEGEWYMENGWGQDEDFVECGAPADWREMPSWDRLAILDRYDEERAEWEAKVADLTEGMNGAIAHAVVERKELTAIRSQVTALTEERDAAWKVLEHTETEKSEECARADKAENELDEALARADRAEKERDEALRSILVQKDTIMRAFEEHDQLRAEHERAIAEGDDLGCQLEALRAVQRGDVADLRTRMEAVEGHIGRLFGEEVPDEVHEHGWQWRPTSWPDTAFAPPFGDIRVCRTCGCLVAGGPTRCARCADDEKGGA